jgi:hypothetical protein
MRRLLSGLMGITVAIGGAGLLAGSAPSPANAVTTTPTAYALGGGGFGTLVRGGQAPANSAPTAYAAIGCTNRAGVTKTGHVAAAKVPGLGTVSGVSTKVWTESAGDTVSSYSRHTTEDLVIASSDVGSLHVEGITTKTRAWHNSTGYHAAGNVDISSITFKPSGGDTQNVEIPTPGNPVTVPGLAKLTIGSIAKSVGSSSARVGADGLVAKVFRSDTEAHVSHAQSQIAGKVALGLFHGRSYAEKGNGVQGNVTNGAHPLLFMACQGTRGLVQKRSIVGVNLGDQVQLDGDLRAEQSATNATKAASGYEQSSVAKADMGNGQVVATGIVGRANVTRLNSGVKSDIKGSTIGKVLVNGQERQFPDSGVMEIPGVAKLEQNVVKRYKTGISVIALRVTLLDGSGAVFNFGFAELKIGRSGL